MKKIKINYIKHNIAPYIVKKVGIFNENGEMVGTVNIDSIKPRYTSDRLYRFGVLSDVHHKDGDNSAEPDEDFTNALKVFNEKESVDFVCICGDLTEYSSASSELERFKERVLNYSPNTRVYVTRGNHDCGISVDDWNTVLYEDAYKETDSSALYHFEFNNDVFIFLGMIQWSLGDSGKPYYDSDIDKLSDLLDRNTDRRCFIFTHLFFKDKAGNFKEVYPPGNWLGGEQYTRLNELNNKHKNTFWFSGHSHWQWHLQEYEQKANVYGADCGWTVHIPSCASPIDSYFDGSSYSWVRDSFSDNCKLSSEGAIVDVYENYIEIRGISFKRPGDFNYTTRYLPCAQYRLSMGSGDGDVMYTDIDFNEIDYVHAEDFTENINKYSPVSVTNIGDDYVEVIFSGDKQGYIIEPNNFIVNPQKAVLYVEDIKYYTAPLNDYNNRTELYTIPSYVGFYGADNTYAIRSDFYIGVHDDGDNNRGASPFQTSSSFTSNNPELNIGTDNVLIIKMKIKIGYAIEII